MSHSRNEPAGRELSSWPVFAWRLAALGQGAAYLLTGLWPLFSRRSFERVTGKKKEWWLVIATGKVIAAVGVVLAGSGLRREGARPEAAALGAAVAGVLGTADVWYVSKGEIGRVYLLDAAAEGVCLALWLSGAAGRERLRG